VRVQIGENGTRSGQVKSVTENSMEEIAFRYISENRFKILCQVLCREEYEMGFDSTSILMG
jgi:hypothetical protein